MPRTSLRLGELLRPTPAWVTLAAALALSVVGVTAIGTGHAEHAAKQMQWLGLGLFVCGLCALPDPRVLASLTPVLLALAMGLLLLVVAPGVPRWLVPVRNGTTAWINLQLMMFQPCEAAKIATVLALARHLRLTEGHRSLAGLLWPFGLVLAPVLLILRQPDLGSAILFPPALLAMLLAGARLRHLAGVVGLGLAAVTLMLAAVFLLPESAQVLRPHQRQRIIAMVSQLRGDDRFNQDIGYQQHKAVTLIGAGGLAGQGPERSATLLRFNRLPEAHNDMIFAVIVNRWGWLGGVGTLALFAVLLLSMLACAAQTKDPFARLAMVGFASLLFGQMTINIGMSLGLLPIIGVTLPLVSYGGSSLLMSFAMIGLVVGFAAQRSPILHRPAFEFGRRERVMPREVWVRNDRG